MTHRERDKMRALFWWIGTGLIAGGIGWALGGEYAAIAIGASLCTYAGLNR